MVTKLRSDSAVARFSEAVADPQRTLWNRITTQMTFIIEAIREDHRITEFRDSCMVAVILARKLASDGFTVSITAPTGRRYPADKFTQLLTSQTLSPNE